MVPESADEVEENSECAVTTVPSVATRPLGSSRAALPPTVPSCIVPIGTLSVLQGALTQPTFVCAPLHPPASWKP